MSKKKKRQRARRIRPDDAFEFAGTTFARYGRFIEIQGNRTEEQQWQLEAHWVAAYPRVISEINDRVLRVRQLISQYDPLDLLKCGFWAMSRSMLGKMSDGEYSHEERNTARMVDYCASRK